MTSHNTQNVCEGRLLSRNLRTLCALMTRGSQQKLFSLKYQSPILRLQSRIMPLLIHLDASAPL